MSLRPAFLVLFAVVLFAVGTGCQENEYASRLQSAPPTVLPPDTIASVHWLGKKHLGITFGAYYFSRIWQQPQSALLERQTLYKLATNLGQWLRNKTDLPADANARLWLLSNDVLQEESYLEIRCPTNAQPSLVFAIRLNQTQMD